MLAELTTCWCCCPPRLCSSFAGSTKAGVAAFSLNGVCKGNVAHLTVSKSSNVSWLVLDDLVKVVVDKAGVIIDVLEDFEISLSPFKLGPGV